MGKIESIYEDIVNISELSDYYDPNSMLTPQQQKDVFRCKVLEVLERKETINRMQRAIDFALNTSNRLFSPEEHIQLEMDVKKMEIPILDASDEKLPLQHCYGISDDEMALWYRAALEQHKCNHFEEAGDLFTLLVTLNPGNESYWLGLGASEQMLQRYQKAIDAYENVVQLSPFSGFSYLLITQCYLLLNDRVSAEGRWLEAKRVIANQESQLHWNELVALLEKTMD